MGPWEATQVLDLLELHRQEEFWTLVTLLNLATLSEASEPPQPTPPELES